MKNLQSFIIGLFIILIIGAGAANAATWTVTKSTNSNDNVCDADCSLREAVFNADSNDTVVFSPNLIGQTFTLGGEEIVIKKRITIDGYLNNPNVAFISGENTSRIFFVNAGAGLTLKNITFVKGNGIGNVPNAGGAIYVDSSSLLSLDRVSVRQNSAANFGGAIYSNQANVYIINSSITTNASTACSAFSLNESNVKIANVTISGNFDSDVNDSSTLGAACLRNSDTTVRNSTIANKSATRGGGIVLVETNGNSLNIGNTIVAENESQTGGDIVDVLGGSTIISAGGNLIGDTSTIPAGIFTQPKDIEGVNPLLAPTNTNSDGFPVLTHPLQAGSPARNGGLNQKRG